MKDIGELIAQLGAWGAAGVLLGVFLNWWISPDTSGGYALLLIVGVCLGIIAGSVHRAIRSPHRS